jgi:hypothetical protein
LLLAGFKVLTAMARKSSTFWAITTCSLVKVNKCFEGTNYLSIFRVEEYYKKPE